MGIAGRIKKGEVLFAKEMGKEIPKIEDATILSGQIEVELKALDKQMEELVSDVLLAVTKDGVDSGKMKDFADRWPKFVERAMKGFDKPSRAHVAFTALSEQMKDLIKVYEKDPLNGAAQKEWLQKISRTAMDIRNILETAIGNSDRIANAEMGIEKALHHLKDLI